MMGYSLDSDETHILLYKVFEEMSVKNDRCVSTRKKERVQGFSGKVLGMREFTLKVSGGNGGGSVDRRLFVCLTKRGTYTGFSIPPYCGVEGVLNAVGTLKGGEAGSLLFWRVLPSVYLFPY